MPPAPPHKALLVRHYNVYNLQVGKYYKQTCNRKRKAAGQRHPKTSKNPKKNLARKGEL
jgi:hypothetical protein